MTLSLMPQGCSIRSNSSVFIAKPTPPSLLTPTGLPHQNIEYPDETSEIWSSPEKRVSDRAMISRLSRLNSSVTRAVRRSGRPLPTLSSRVRTFQQPIEIGTRF